MALAAVKKAGRMPDLSTVPAVDEVGVNERVARFQSRSNSKVTIATVAWLQQTPWTRG